MSTARPILEDFKTHPPSRPVRPGSPFVFLQRGEGSRRNSPRWRRELGYLGRDAACHGGRCSGWASERRRSEAGSRASRSARRAAHPGHDGGAHMVAEAGESPGMSNFGVREFDLLARRALEQTPLPLPRCSPGRRLAGQSFLTRRPGGSRTPARGCARGRVPPSISARFWRGRSSRRTVEIIGVTNGGLGEIESEGAEDPDRHRDRGNAVFSLRDRTRRIGAPENGRRSHRIGHPRRSSPRSPCFSWCSP